MKPRQMIKMAVDLLMTALLFPLMAFHLTGRAAHEWIGAGMFLLFLLHSLLNRRWYAGLRRGRYTSLRVLQTAVNLLVLLSMLVQMASGVLLSRYAFRFLGIAGYAAPARMLHLLGAYWGFVLMSLHVGLHWDLVLGMARRMLPARVSEGPLRLVARLGAALTALYGAAAFARHGLLSYMLLEARFVFFDHAQSPLSFFADYLSMACLWAFAAHCAGKLARRVPARGRRKCAPPGQAA